MAGEYRQHVALYVVAGLDKLAFGFLRFNQDRQPNVICEIKEALSEKMRWDDTKRFELYKVDFTPQESLALRSNNLPSMDPTAKLHDFDEVGELWHQGFPLDSTAFVADMMPDTPPPGSDHERSSVQVKIYEEAQSLVMSSFSNLTPSKLAKAIPFMKHQATENAIYNGRPQNRTGPPIGLYFSIFDSFVAGLEDSTRDIPPKKLEAALSLLERSQEQYKTELSSSGRTAALVPGLNKLLGTKLFNREVAGAKPDGSISAANGAPCLVVEMKNEVGMGGCDPCIQGAISYVKFWSDPNQDDIRPASCCPSFILAIAGPYMCVLGAIMLDHPVVQLLTPFFWVGDHVNPAFHSDICALARLFISLSDSVKELKKFYNSLESDDRNPARFYPYIRQFKLQGHSTNFQYVEALFPNKLVFEACMGVGTNKRMLIVKFAESYNAKAHRLLAEKRLAPELLFVSSEHRFKVGRCIMIVMEKVKGESLVGHMPAPECVKKSVLAALELLHKHSIVFGDLQPSNVMAVKDDQGQPDRGMLVDFDWCGIEDEAKYPATMDKEIKWPDGVGPGVVMKAEHDREMFGKMFPS